MLRAVHRPVVLPGPGGRVEPTPRRRAARARSAPGGEGREGWNDAVLAVLTGRRLPSLSRGAGEPRLGRASEPVRSGGVAARG